MSYVSREARCAANELSRLIDNHKVVGRKMVEAMGARERVTSNFGAKQVREATEKRGRDDEN
jgi:hypothetical protein